MNSAQLEANLTSFERIEEYCRTPNEVMMIFKLQIIIILIHNIKSKSSLTFIIFRLLGESKNVNHRKNGLVKEK